MKFNINIKLSSSLTLEAALTLPFFIVAISAFLYFFHIISIYEHIQYAITEIANEASSYAYAYETILNNNEDKSREEIEDEKKEENKKEENKAKNKKDNTDERVNEELNQELKTILGTILDSSYIKIKLYEYLDVDEINESAVKNGINGIRTYLSSFMKDDRTIDIIVTYKINIPIPFFNLNTIDVLQRVRVRAFSGKYVNKKDSEDVLPSDIVFITKYGTVYHKDNRCSHIKLNITPIPSEELIHARNENGGKYKACDLCLRNNNSIDGLVVYIAKSGDRYHIKLECSGLKRLIEQISFADVGTRTPCKRCYKN